MGRSIFYFFFFSTIFYYLPFFVLFFLIIFIFIPLSLSYLERGLKLLLLFYHFLQFSTLCSIVFLLFIFILICLSLSYLERGLKLSVYFGPSFLLWLLPCSLIFLFKGFFSLISFSFWYFSIFLFLKFC
jgi:hypothetical protein